MAFNGLKPAVTDGKVSLLTGIRDNFARLATLFQGGAGGDSTIPTNAKRIDNDGTVYYWNGTAWTKVWEITTSVGTPGVDTKLTTEKAVRDALAGAGGTPTNYTPTLNGFDGTTSTLTGRYVTLGGFCILFVNVSLNTLGTSGGNDFAVSLPVQARNINSSCRYFGSACAHSSGTGGGVSVLPYITNNATQANISNFPFTDNITYSEVGTLGSDFINFTIMYPTV